MDWQDIPTAITPLLKSRSSEFKVSMERLKISDDQSEGFTRVNGPPRAKRVEKPKGGILKEIHLLPNVRYADRTWTDY